MKVKILKGQNVAEDDQGNVYQIAGIEIIKENGVTAVYGTDTSFFKAVAPDGITCSGYLVGDNLIMLR